VSALEDRLRDAYRDAAGTVIPGSVRSLEERIARRARPGRRRKGSARRWGRILAPLSAAAAVVAIIVLVAVALQPSPGRSGLGRSSAGRPSAGQSSPGLFSAGRAVPGISAGDPKFIITATGGTSPSLLVSDVLTGASVGTVSLPDPNLAHGGNIGVTSVATADGRHYLVALEANPCRSWLYQFTLNDRGQPGAVTAFAALPTVKSLLYDLTISGNGKMIGYTTTVCMGAKSHPSYVAATSTRTGQTARWTVPGGGLVDSVSLTADGGELCYSLQDDPSGVRVIPTTAAPGSAADRGRTVVAAAAQFGPSEWVSFAAITPDGKAVYFTTYPETSRGPGPGQVRVVDLATGRTRLVYAPAGSAGLITVDPLVRYFLLQTGKLALLDLATGKIRYLPSGFLSATSGVIWW
jgi:hypothetical protein